MPFDGFARPLLGSRDPSQPVGAAHRPDTVARVRALRGRAVRWRGRPSPPAVDAGVLVGRSILRFGQHRLRAAALAALLSVFIVATGAPAPAAASTPADSVIALAKTKLGAPWHYGAIGPRSFDCSGFVYYVFRRTGNLWRIGGRRMTAYGYYMYFRHRGLASRTGGRRGDLVVWGGGSHIGIYIGNGKAISALTSGVRIHGIYAVRARFTAFLHTRMSVSTVVTTAPVVVAPTPIPTPTLAPSLDPATVATPAPVPTPTPLLDPSPSPVSDPASAVPSATVAPTLSAEPADSNW
jgi:NlpC/P60 family